MPHMGRVLDVGLRAIRAGSIGRVEEEIPGVAVVAGGMAVQSGGSTQKGGALICLAILVVVSVRATKRDGPDDLVGLPLDILYYSRSHHTPSSATMRAKV